MTNAADNQRQRLKIENEFHKKDTICDFDKSSFSGKLEIKACFEWNDEMWKGINGSGEPVGLEHHGGILQWNVAEKCDNDWELWYLWSFSLFKMWDIRIFFRNDDFLKDSIDDRWERSYLWSKAKSRLQV